MSGLLQAINSPEDLKQVPVERMPEVAAEIRELLITTLSRTGGHLGGNLGAVELTLALHYVFDSPTDKIVWDVGHQCYVHKILTGRREKLETLRQYKGLAGFTKISESEHDVYGAGHASTAISAAYGLAVGRDLAAEDHQVVAVVGDGALTGGAAYEGLNNLGSSRRNMIVILNDNSMSISPNVGAISEYLTGLLADQTYNRIKAAIWDLTGRVKGGQQFREAVGKIDNSIKSLLVPGVLFEKLGVRYFGPIDGHDTAGLIKVLRRLKSLSGPRLLHIRTVKGKGYLPAEEDHCRLHGVSKFDKVTGKLEPKNGTSFTKVFGRTAVEIAGRDDKVVALTAAMPTGTGLEKFAETYPERFFDVGIAEQHASLFAAGLARAGRKPIVAIYSTFLQRAYDMLIHDLALQKLPVLLAIDRAGLVGNDGPTHHGCFDISYLRLVPDMQICAPRDGKELQQLLELAVASLDGPIAVRFPRANIPDDQSSTHRADFRWGSWEQLRRGSDGAILAVGSMVEPSLAAAALAESEGVGLEVINCRFVKPFDEGMLEEIAGRHSRLLTVEEGSLAGGFGSAVSDWLHRKNRHDTRLACLGIPDRFIEHGSRSRLLSMLSLDAEGIAAAAIELTAAKASHSLVFRRTTHTNETLSDLQEATAEGKK
jgi:1-deoxy-D-xylulose-5-phosphate synthase